MHCSTMAILTVESVSAEHQFVAKLADYVTFACEALHSMLAADVCL